MKIFSYVNYILITLLFITACSNINEGEIDYVRTIDNKILPSVNCSSNDYENSLNTPAGMTRNCYETLYRKYQDAPAIKEGNTISVHMMQGYILGSNESRTFYELFSGRAANAEVVVIASVCEQGISGCGLEFGPSSDKAGRVIYFSDGVKAKQYLNFSYLPVYGPIKYKGGPLIVKLSILELDDMSDKQVGLLKALAEQGKKAYPPASTALTILDTLGTSLLQGSGDDVNFRYTMTLTPGTGDNGYSHPILSAGNYAFLKKDTVKGPQEQEIWKHLKFDHITGRLVQECKEKDEAKGMHNINSNTTVQTEVVDYTYCTGATDSGLGFKDFRERTYLTFQIQTGFVERTLDQPQTLQALINEINAENDIDAQFVTDATEDLGDYLTRTANENKLKQPLAAIKSATSDGLHFDLDTILLNANKFAQEYIKAINYRNTSCAEKDCSKAISEDDIWSITQNTRQIVLALDPAADIDEANGLNLPIPSSYSDDDAATVKSNIIKLFKNAYLQYYQNKLNQHYWSIGSNLLQSYNRLKWLTINKKPFNQEQAKVRNIALSFLFKLKSDIALFITANCKNEPEKNACYKLFKESEFKSVLAMTRNIFDTIGKEKGTGTEILLDSLLENGLDMPKLQQLLDDIDAK